MKHRKWMRVLAVILSSAAALSVSPVAAYASSGKAHTYVSMTQSAVSDSSDPDIRNVYVDLRTGRPRTAYAHIPTPQDQPSLYDRKRKQTYYVARTGRNDNLSVHSKKGSRRLTSTFYNVNNIYQLDRRLFLVAEKKNESAALPFIYDLRTGKLKRVDTDKDRMVCAANVSGSSNEFFYADFSSATLNRRADAFNAASGDSRTLKVSCNVYAVDKCGKRRKLFRTKASVENLAGNKNYILCTTVSYKGWTHDGVEDIKEIRKTYIFNRRTKKLENIRNISHPKGTKDSGIISMDGKNTVLMYENSASGSKLIKYNIRKRQRKTVYSVRNYHISSASLIR